MRSLFITIFLGWLTHVFFCFYAGTWGFLIAGAILFPIAILHGWYLWLAGLASLILTLASTVIGWII